MKAAGIIIALFFIIGTLIAVGGFVFNAQLLSRNQSETRGPAGEGGVLISENGGAFVPIASLGGLEVHTIAFSRNPEVVYLGAKYYGLWVSQNGGKKFAPAKDKLLKNTVDVYDIEEAMNGDLYLAAYRDDRGSVIYATAGKAPAETYFSPIARFGVFGVASENTRTVSFISSDGGYYRSVNAGKSWEVRSRNKEGLLKLRQAPGGTVWTVTSENKILRSSDAGKTWTDASITKKGSRAPIRDLSFDPRTGTLLASSDKLYRSTDGGTTWQSLNLIVPANSVAIDAAAVHPTSSNVIFAASGNVLYKSIDAGESWSITTLPTTRTVRVIAINPRNPETVLIGTAK